jgi:phage replication O-like protein O
MANPQKENGHLDIANELVDIFARTHLTGNSWQLIFAVLRKTWCWKKKTDWISLTQLEHLTGLNRVSVCRAKKSLVSKMILLETGNKIGLNKDYSQWVVSKTTLVSKTAMGSVKKVLGGSVKNDTYKRNYTKETNTKEMRVNLKSKNNKPLGDLVTGDEYTPDGNNPLYTLKEKKRLERCLGLRRTNKWASFIFGAGWDFLKAYEATYKRKYFGNVILDEVAKNLSGWFERGETRETIREMIIVFLESEKKERVGMSPTTVFSVDTYNKWKNGELKPKKKHKEFL